MMNIIGFTVSAIGAFLSFVGLRKRGNSGQSQRADASGGSAITQMQAGGDIVQGDVTIHQSDPAVTERVFDHEARIAELEALIPSILPGVSIRRPENSEHLESAHPTPIMIDSTLSLKAGANLVSFPTEQEDSSISAVVGHAPDISLVITYDNMTGLWLISTRDEDPESETFGEFIGNLNNIRAGMGYWIVVESGVSLQLAPAPRVAEPIELFEGWNLMGALTGFAKLGAST